MFHRKLLFALAACLPLALAGCGGGGGGGASSSPTTESPSGGSGTQTPSDTGGQSRVTDLNVTHVEWTSNFGLPSNLPTGGSSSPLSVRTEIVCDGGTTCIARVGGAVAEIPVSALISALEGASDLTNGFSWPVQGGTRYGIEIAVKKTTETEEGATTTGTIIGGVGQFSAFATGYGWTNGVYDDAQSYALGERTASRPLARGIWRGAMVGTLTTASGPPALVGRAELTYDIGDNTIDVEISSVSAVSCTFSADACPPALLSSGRDVVYAGERSFSWSDVQVQSDGRFHQAGSGNDHITGNFYGPAATETAGVFERGSVIGAWLAELVESDPVGTTGGTVDPSGGGAAASGGDGGT